MRSVLVAVLVLGMTGAATAQHGDAYWQNVERNRQLQRQTELMEQQAAAAQQQAAAAEEQVRLQKRAESARFWENQAREMREARQQRELASVEPAPRRRAAKHKWKLVGSNGDAAFFIALDTLQWHSAAPDERTVTMSAVLDPDRVSEMTVTVTCGKSPTARFDNDPPEKISPGSMTWEVRKTVCKMR